MTRISFFMVSVLLIGISHTDLAARETKNYERDLHKVQIYIKDKDFASAEALLKKMVSQFPKNPEILSIQARLYFWEGDYEKSIAVYDQLLRITPTRTIREELEKVLLADELRGIDRLWKSGQVGEAGERLEKLYNSGRGGYDVAYRFGTFCLDNKKYTRALEVFADMRTRYPKDSGIDALYIQTLMFRGAQSEQESAKQDDFSTAERLLAERLGIQPDNSEFLFLQARLYFWEKRYDESIGSYRKLLRIRPTKEAAEGLMQVEVASELKDIDGFLRDGEVKAARERLETLYKAGSAPYESGYRLGHLYLRERDYHKSLQILGELRKKYPGDPGIGAPYVEALYLSGRVAEALSMIEEEISRRPANIELLAVKARISYWAKRYDAALTAYDELLRIKPDIVLAKEREQVAAAWELAAIDALLKGGDRIAAQERLEKLYRSGTTTYEAGSRLGTLYVQEKMFDRALQVYEELHRKYPEDKGFEALWIETLVLAGNVDKARKALAALPSNRREALGKEREELFYRVRPNYLLVKGEYDWFTRGNKDGNELLAETSLKAGRLSLVPRYASVSRFGLHNNQLGLEISSKLGDRSGRWGYLSLSYSPDAEFLPEWTAGAAIYQGFGNYEFFAGYTRMNFPRSGVDIVAPGAIAYLSDGLALEGKLYLVPRRGSVTGAIRVVYAPDHRIKAFYSLAIGQSAEKIVAQQDFQKLFTVSQKAGAEYRLREFLSVGAELSYSYREQLYNTTGLTLFTRYWW